MKNNFDLRKFLTENKNSIKEENINELTGDQREAILDLQNILDELSQKGNEAREIVRQSFPRMLSKADAYGAFDFGSSANTYDTTLESIIKEIEEYYDEEEEDLDEGSKAEHSPEEIAAIMSDPDYDGEHSSDFVDEEDLDEQLNEISPGDIQDLVHGIVGTGLGTAAVYGVGKLIDALESGKWREKGIKIAKAIRDLAKDEKNEELHTNEVKKK